LPSIEIQIFSEIILASNSKLSILYLYYIPHTTMMKASKTSHADTPPQSPEAKANDSELQMALQVIVDLLARKGTSLDEFAFSSPPPPPPNTPKEPSTERTRASKLAYQNVT